MNCRQTSCRYCGQDIENFSPFKAGEWRDRGNNSTCPTKAGDRDGLKHAPYMNGRQVKVCADCHGPLDVRTRNAGGERCYTCSTEAEHV